MVGWDVVASNSEGRYGQIEMLIRPMCEFKKEAREHLTRSGSLFMGTSQAKLILDICKILVHKCQQNKIPLGELKNII